MNRLATHLVNLIRDKVIQSVVGLNTQNVESRFIFHGPPLDILEIVYQELAKDKGVIVSLGNAGEFCIPVLIQYPQDKFDGVNPAIGASGRCDENHLLHIRNDPNYSSFVALIPPGLHSNRSVTSTTDEFGINASNNSGHAGFEDWWNDPFVQQLFHDGIKFAGFDSSEVIELIYSSASSLDQLDTTDGSRSSVWKLLSRIYEIEGNRFNLKPGSAISLACGVPGKEDGSLDQKSQITILVKIANALSDGFKTGVNKLKMNAGGAEVEEALNGFLAHLIDKNVVPTSFERATAAVYLPSNSEALLSPVSWWNVLTLEKWTTLLEGEEDEIAGDLNIECRNQLFSSIKGLPSIVRNTVELSVSLVDPTSLDADVKATISGGGFGRNGMILTLSETNFVTDTGPSLHKIPLTYKVIAENYKTSTVKVISLDQWVPNVLVISKFASKFSPPKKVKSHSGIDWESSFSLPGSGRFELVLLLSTGSDFKSVLGGKDDTDVLDAKCQKIEINQIDSDVIHFEIDTEQLNYIDVEFSPKGKKQTEVCRVYIFSEEIKEEGCRSVFERLIRINRQHLERFDVKSVVQLDRHARISSLQSWMLDDESIEQSFIPIIIAEDYSGSWAPPKWNLGHGPKLSSGRFLHDPRPLVSAMTPPIEFVTSRRKLGFYIRGQDDQSGLVESAELGTLFSKDPVFRSVVETYLDAYLTWMAEDYASACWCDVIAVCAIGSDNRTLSRTPDAVMLSPLHPLRFAWHCLAQKTLYKSAFEENTPCPGASILDPSCVPDLFTLSIQEPDGIQLVDYISVESSSDYWSVLWNGSKLGELSLKSQLAPFDTDFGISIGGISSGFSTAQVSRALSDVSDLLCAKPILSILVASEGGSTDSCNDGLIGWATQKFGSADNDGLQYGIGLRNLEVFDTRKVAKPDQATIANLSEDTFNKVRWFDRQPPDVAPDLGILAQLDSAQPESKIVGINSPLSFGGLIRHRVRRQLHSSFISESRQSKIKNISDDVFANKVVDSILLIENQNHKKTGLQFAPNIHALADILEKKNASFVAASSTAIDPACFLGGTIQGAYLWDYDLPSYSRRAGDTSGYYLLSKIKDADQDTLHRVLKILPDCSNLNSEAINKILLEVAKRGIPTIRGLSAGDAGAAGDLGMFIASRLLQDKFRIDHVNIDSLLPVLSGTENNVTISLIIPVDPFRGYLADISHSLNRRQKDLSLERPDLLVIGIKIVDTQVRIHLTPVEVKYRQNSMTEKEAKAALGQSESMRSLLAAIRGQADKSDMWRMCYQHLLLSMIGFGLRVYSLQRAVADQTQRWASYHELIAEAILGSIESISVDAAGRLIIIDSSSTSDALDYDNDGFNETIVISHADAGKIVSGDCESLYKAVRAKVGDWRLLPEEKNEPKLEASEALNPTHQDMDNKPDSITFNSVNIQESLNGKIVFSEPISENLDCTGVLLDLGKTVDGFEKNQVALNISDTRLNQLNIGVVGDLGTGKTQFLKSLISQISRSKEQNRGITPRFLIFDYKRDYSSDDFVAATGAKVVKPNNLPLNLFNTSSIVDSVAPWLDRFRFFADVLDKVYSGIGPVQRDKLKNAVKLSYETCKIMGREPTIYDVHASYKELLAGKTDSPMSIIDDLVDMQVFSSEESKIKPFDEFLDGVVVISLDALGQDDRSKNMLVAIMLNMFYENMLKIAKRPFLGTDPQLRVIDSYLLVDEADNIMRYEFDVLRKLLLQGREFGVGVILASQYLRHFKVGATDYRDPLLTWFIHKVPNVTASELNALGFTSDLGELSDRVKTLDNHNCLFKTYNNSGEVIRGLPFFELDLINK